MMEMMTMKFYRGNRLDGEFEMPVAEVASAFLLTVTSESGDWRLKLESWPLERTLRDWLTSQDGLNSTWDEEHGEESFGALYLLVRDRLH